MVSLDQGKVGPAARQMPSLPVQQRVLSQVRGVWLAGQGSMGSVVAAEAFAGQGSHRRFHSLAGPWRSTLPRMISK
jgi:hypothetical protein